MDIKRKLTSRKFWLALIGFITPLLTAFKVADSDITQITAIIMAGGTLIAYILAEGFTDAMAPVPDDFLTYDEPEGLEDFETETDEV